ncbi:unnamed protein product [Phytophthora lilii]|uniref:Unnamed protein product n=1 Tax=Phytophthora lilii TaxID=2077276 RepID=A0A9W6TGM4_9STRA|nr:unnamed protein product [Phytophthora lilii]
MTDKASYRSKLSQPVPGTGYCENSDNLVSVFSIQTDGLSVEATPGLEPTPVLPHDKLAMNIKSSQVVNDASFRLASVYHRGWLSRSTAPSSESRTNCGDSIRGLAKESEEMQLIKIVLTLVFALDLVFRPRPKV